MDVVSVLLWCMSRHAGDLKLVEKPQPIVMSPHDFTNIKASVKVASTENGIIFGNIGTFSCMRIFVSEFLHAKAATAFGAS